MICTPLSFNNPSTTDIYTLSLHDALPIFERNTTAGPKSPCACQRRCHQRRARPPPATTFAASSPPSLNPSRSEEHTSELQSLRHLVCRLLLEKKNKITSNTYSYSIEN